MARAATTRGHFQKGAGAGVATAGRQSGATATSIPVARRHAGANILWSNGGLVDMGGWPGYTWVFCRPAPGRFRSPWRMLLRATMPEAAPIPAPGQIAQVRQRLYLVEQVVPAPVPGDSMLVKLSCVDDDAQGQRLGVLWEREIDPEIRTGKA